MLILFLLFILGSHKERRIAVKNVFRPDSLNEAIEEESDSDKDKNPEAEEMIRPSSMYAKTHYGEDRELGPSVIVSEKTRIYKRALKLRERQLTKAFTIIRKQQLSNIFVREYVK